MADATQDLLEYNDVIDDNLGNALQTLKHL